MSAFSEDEQGRGRVDRIQNQRLVDSAVEAVRTAILQGRIPPGQRLLEVPLARELGISRSVLREALQLLEKDGIIQSIPRHGKFVQTFDSRAIDELYSLRRVLESFAVELLCRQETVGAVTVLRAALERMTRAAREGDVLLLAREDIAFHQTLVELAGHTLLKRAWMENIAGKLHILLNITEPTHQPLQDALDRHGWLVDGLAARDRRRAQALIEEHIDDAWQRAGVSMLKQTECPA